MFKKNKRPVMIVCTIGFFLLVALVLTLFTDYVDWNTFDFIIFGILLSVAGLIYELIFRKVIGVKLRWALLAALFILLILLWAELAVGIFGTRFAGD